MKISGLIIASDGENKKGMIDLIDIPFYGGRKYLMKDKILAPSTQLVSGEPLISAPIQAMGESTTINDFVIVGRQEQCEELEALANKYSNGKPFRVVQNEGHIGDTLALGSENINLPGYCLVLQPDLPLVSGTAIDSVVLEIMSATNPEVAVYFPVIDKDFFQQYSQGWVRPFFPELNNGSGTKRVKSLDFVVADSTRINPEFVRKFYNIRRIRSLKGKINAFREFPEYVPELFLRYSLRQLSVRQLEDVGSELNGHRIKIVQIQTPYASAFMKDIDTRGDYQTYLRAVTVPKN